ncbi:protrudin-like [Conger conger]|uniref:protrudin-like n=1 Tax=Conger conger TaxID=82655 RepID=UPI002A5A0036|nr:protrudin-like [Conger conger]
MPQSRANSAPCLYFPQTGEDASNTFVSSEALTFDVFNTVTTLRKLLVFLEPVTICCRLVKYVLGWKICSLLGCVLLNVLFLTLSEEAWFLLGLLCTLALATLGYLKGCPRWGGSKRAFQRRSSSGERAAELHPSQQELALELKSLLLELDGMMSQACLSAESTYRLLCWGRCRSSALFYGSLLTLLYLLYTAPGRYTLLLTNSALFLWKGELHQVVRNIFWRRSKTTEDEQSVNRGKTPSPGHAGLSWVVGDSNDPDADYDFKDAIEDGDDDDSPLMLRRGALVGLIPSFHQKGQKRARRPRLHSSSNSGNCSRCNTSFSVLKKKKNCSNCGSSFCTRCCCKVQRSCLDTAAPDQNGTVFVCNLCNVSLSKQE